MKMPFDIEKMLRMVRYGDRVQPARDWFVLLSLAAALVVASIGWNIWLLAKVEHGEAVGSEAAPAVFEAAPVEAVQEVFEMRKEEELRYRQQYRFVDPSLPGS